MAELSGILSDERRPAAVQDLAVLVEQAVDKQSGMTGTALRTALKGAKKVSDGVVERGVNRVLPDIVSELEPLWRDFEAAGAADFGAYLGEHSEQATAALLSVADRHRDGLPGPISKLYSSLREKAEKLLTPELPDLGAVMQKHVR